MIQTENKYNLIKIWHCQLKLNLKSNLSFSIKCVVQNNIKCFCKNLIYKSYINVTIIGTFEQNLLFLKKNIYEIQFYNPKINPKDLE
ncbi:unnamed protein product [Paramecium primaurelia]|uniref:Uncharacterized protein n=1 Tax=Paramecium primaurelia TaxID=5886 RepID=A0A8S1QNK0_PARPR|nr:unnamed protein product [Paramecium primaurelia]